MEETPLVRTEVGGLWVFDGPDGSGKSTLCRAVAATLDGFNIKNKVLAFPSHQGEIGKLIRRVLTGQAHVELDAMMHLFIADGLDHELQITQWRNEGYEVLLDRHTIVTGWAYQLEHHPIADLLQAQVGQMFQAPSCAFISDVPTAVSSERIKERNKRATDAPHLIYEKPYDAEYQERLRRRYTAYAIVAQHPVGIIDGTKPLADNIRSVLSIIRGEA